MNGSEPTRPLHGIRVLDVTQFAAGPYGTMIFADAGADVIKIERPGEGDQMRQLGPFIGDREGRRVGGAILRMARNKRSLALDITKPIGQALFRDLVKQADVVWENFVPGLMDRLGLGYRQLREVNPRIVYAAVSGFGHTDIHESPFWRRPAFDLIAQAMSGMMDITGQPGGPPTAVPAPVADLVPALYCVIGVLMALRMRELTGFGQMVDISMYDSMASMMERPATTYSMTGTVLGRGQELLNGPYGTYRASDGYVVIATPHQRGWEHLCRAIGREDLLAVPELATPADRAQHAEDILRPILEAWLAGRPKVTAAEHLIEHGVAAAAVQTVGEMMECPHIAARRMVLTMEHPVAGAVRLVGNPIKLSAVPEPDARPAPGVGEQGTEILGEILGYDADHIAALRAEGIIG